MKYADVNKSDMTPFLIVTYTRAASSHLDKDWPVSKKATRSGRKYRGRTPEQLREERRQRLLQAGFALFGEQGYGNAPIETICSTASVATRHFYEQFDGREGLLRAVFEVLIAELGSVIQSQLNNAERDAHERMSDAIGQAVLHLLSDPRRAKLLCLETVGVSREMEAFRRAAIHGLAAIIRDYTQNLAIAGTLPERNYHFPAVGMVGMVNELVTEWLVTDTGLDAGGMAREAVLLFRAVIIGTQRYSSDWPIHQ